MNALSAIEIERIEHEFGGKWRAKRDEKKATKDNRKLARKAANRADKTANQLQKIGARREGGTALDKITGSLSGIFGGSATESDPGALQDRSLQIGFADEAAAAAAAKKQQTNMIIIAVVVILVIALGFYFFNKKNKKDAA